MVETVGNNAFLCRSLRHRYPQQRSMVPSISIAMQAKSRHCSPDLQIYKHTVCATHIRFAILLCMKHRWLSRASWRRDTIFPLKLPDARLQYISAPISYVAFFSLPHEKFSLVRNKLADNRNFTGILHRLRNFTGSQLSFVTREKKKYVRVVKFFVLATRILFLQVYRKPCN